MQISYSSSGGSRDQRSLYKSTNQNTFSLGPFMSEIALLQRLLHQIAIFVKQNQLFKYLYMN